jgi:GTP-binding protein
VPSVIIDTGGLVENPIGIEAQMRAQTERAVAEADRLVLLADARAGLSPQDYFVARELRRSGKPVTLVLNKAEGLDADVVAADFHALGFGEPLAISASHGQGCETLMEQVLAGFAAQPDEDLDRDAIRIAIIGRPNVGKSTLVNRLLGEERVIANEEPGTTRDSILVPFERDGRAFILIDTAGVRRRAKVEDVVERASVAKTLQAIAEAHVVILVLDAHEGIAEQDASVLGIALERGRALIIAVNKWDGIAPEQREEIHRQLSLKLDFVPFAPLHFISARHGTGVGELMQSTVRAYEAAMRTMPSSSRQWRKCRARCWRAARSSARGRLRLTTSTPLGRRSISRSSVCSPISPAPTMHTVLSENREKIWRANCTATEATETFPADSPVSV